ncbi:hypothetical protein [Aeromicrobium sp.]|uniref:hypothetical protein n=1 Tax=Aeromicrobium sp. TaxID=1871063 RepID=UPI003512EBDD
MTTLLRIAAIVLAGIVVLGAGFGLGRAVGPIGDSASPTPGQQQHQQHQQQGSDHGDH